MYDPELTDTWSLGIVLFSMVFTKLPFEDKNTTVLYNKIKAGMYLIERKISVELRDLLSRLLCVQPKNRYNIQQIKEHPWYKREFMLPCHGIRVGFENLAVDHSILEEMEQLNYNSMLAKRYLENDIRN